MKVALYNKFHNKFITVSIKDEYCKHSEFRACDPLAMLEYEVYDDGSDKKYAQKKLREIKDKTCGSSDCHCCTVYDPEKPISE